MQNLKIVVAEQEIRRRRERKEESTKYDWSKIARPKQILPDGDWFIWVIMTGRGWGKNKTASETTRMLIEKGLIRNGIIVGRTYQDMQKYLIKGDSGILSVFPPWNKPKWNKYDKEIVFPNGAILHTATADVPDSIRGSNLDWFVLDEFASYQYPEEVFDNLMFAMRVKHPTMKPRGMIITTPRNIQILKDIISRKNIILTRGSSYENADNLAESFVEDVLKPKEGSAIGNQEIYGEIITDIEGALWKIELISKYRVQAAPETFKRIVIAVDPAGTSGKKSDDTGIVVGGLHHSGEAYILKDASIKGSPSEWANEIIRLYDLYKADAIIAEKNYGGDMVETTIKTAAGGRVLKIKTVNATRGKIVRAEPAQTAYSKGLVHHVGVLPLLEDQMCTYTGDPKEKSPDRLDALVWLLYDLILKPAPTPHLRFLPS